MTPEEYAVWTGLPALTPAQSQRYERYLAAADALIRRIAAPAELEDPLPVDLEAIMVDMVTRATTIPAGKIREDLGDYSWTGSGGLGATPEEVDRIREAAGAPAIVEIHTSGVLPINMYHGVPGGHPYVYPV